MGKPTDLLQGSLDLLILNAVPLGPLHGFGVLLRIQQLSSETLDVAQGSLHPALHRLVGRGWIGSEWGISENRRKARFYSLTGDRRRQLDAEAREVAATFRGRGGRPTGPFGAGLTGPWRWLGRLIRRSRFEREMRDDSQSHLAHLIDDLVAGGLSALRRPGLRATRE